MNTALTGMHMQQLWDNIDLLYLRIGVSETIVGKFHKIGKRKASINKAMPSLESSSTKSKY